MSFDNPSALWLLALALLLLFARRRTPLLRTYAGNLHLWSQLATQAAPAFSRRVRRHWLLILQAAFLIAVIVALARPIAPIGTAHVAVVMDVSVSMGARQTGTTRIGSASTRATSLAASLPRGTRVHVIAAGATPKEIGDFVASDNALERALSSLRVSSAGADLDAAIRTARSANPGPARIYVLSDSARRPPSASAADVEWLGVGTAADNVAITTVGVRRVAPGSRAARLVVTAWNYGASAVDTSIAVTQNGVVLTSMPVNIGAKRAITVSTTLSNAGGVVTARVDASDALPADNERAIMMPPDAPVRVLVHGASFFVEKALSANPGIALVSDRTVSDTGGSGAQPFDVVVCEGCSEAPGNSGGLLLIPPPSSQAAIAAPLTSTADHPVTDAVDLDGISTIPISVQRPDDEGTIVARAGGSPAIVAYEASGRRVVELRLDPASSDLPLSTAFPILVANAIDWLAARDRNPITLVAGDPLQWVLPDGARAADISVIGPDGEAVAVVIADRRLTLSPPGMAGLYRVRMGAEEHAFVVNPVIEGESDLTAVSADDAADTGTLGVQFEHRDLTIPALFAALALLATEWWYRGRLRRA